MQIFEVFSDDNFEHYHVGKLIFCRTSQQFGVCIAVTTWKEYARAREYEYGFITDDAQRSIAIARWSNSLNEAKNLFEEWDEEFDGSVLGNWLDDCHEITQ